jgi:hypothetical protein
MFVFKKCDRQNHADLTNGIHLLKTLCPDDPPEAAELLDYFDTTPGWCIAV